METYFLQPLPMGLQTPPSSLSGDMPTPIYPLYENALERHENAICRACAALDALGMVALADELCRSFNQLL